jgi:hypothetical protein
MSKLPVPVANEIHHFFQHASSTDTYCQRLSPAFSSRFDRQISVFKMEFGHSGVLSEGKLGCGLPVHLSSSKSNANGRWYSRRYGQAEEGRGQVSVKSSWPSY